MGIIVDGKTYISRNQYFDHLAEENKKLKEHSLNSADLLITLNLKLSAAKDELAVVKKCLTSSLEIQAGQGVSVECSKLEDVLQEENDKLFVENVIMKDALEFYADEINYLYDSYENYCIISSYDESDYPSDNCPHARTGGKLARKVLKELE